MNKWSKLYCLWVFISICLAIMVSPNSPENRTRILVILFLLLQILFKEKMLKFFSKYSPKNHFILLGTTLAIVVEGFHMISMPVFSSIKFTENDSFLQCLNKYMIDLIFTVPAYLIIFYVIWKFINKYSYSLWTYIIVMGFAQAIGDGGLFFFINSPFLILFLPYPMTNYHAINIIPYLAVSNNLNENRILSKKSYLVIPTIIGTYFICGATIKIIGKLFGFS